MPTQLDLLGNVQPIDRSIGKANGEFIAHLIEVREGRRDMAWLRKTCPNVARQVARDNLTFWGVK